MGHDELSYKCHEIYMPVVHTNKDFSKPVGICLKFRRDIWTGENNLEVISWYLEAQE